MGVIWTVSTAGNFPREEYTADQHGHDTGSTFQERLFHICSVSKVCRANDLWHGPRFQPAATINNNKIKINNNRKEVQARRRSEP